MVQLELPLHRRRADWRLTLTENRPLAAWREARAEAGIETKPVIVGPLSFLKLAHGSHGLPLAALLDRLLPLYAQLLAELAEAGVAWVQIDEPVLVADPSAADLDLLAHAYSILATGPTPKLMLQTYFDDLGAAWEAVTALPVAGVGLDFVRGRKTSITWSAAASRRQGDGGRPGRRPQRLAYRPRGGARHPGADRPPRRPRPGPPGPSSSLLHLPVTVALEAHLDPTIKAWLAYADERLAEIAVLARAVAGGREAVGAELAASRELAAARRADPRVTDPAVTARVAALTDADARRDTPPAERRARQGTELGLPPLPTTTIGSYPQTAEVRNVRARYRAGTRPRRVRGLPRRPVPRGDRSPGAARPRRPRPRRVRAQRHGGLLRPAAFWDGFHRRLAAVLRHPLCGRR